MFRQLIAKQGISVLENTNIRKTIDTIKAAWNQYSSIESSGARPEKSLVHKENDDSEDSLIDHLIFAYLVENTGIYEVFYKVVAEFRNGGKFAPQSQNTMYWLDLAEALIFNDNQRFAPHQIATTLRPDSGAVRRNAYYRMFGMDLNHGPFNYIKPAIANKEFVATFENFLKEVWVGLVNFGNTSGINQTDDEAIRDYAQKLRDMLLARKLNETGFYNNLRREEFHAVTVMSFLYMTIDNDGLSILKDLKATGETNSERLTKIASAVNVPIHSKTSNFLDLADPASKLMRILEDKTWSIENNTQIFYKPSNNSDLPSLMRKIINNWSIVTGRNMKEKIGGRV